MKLSALSFLVTRCAAAAARDLMLMSCHYALLQVGTPAPNSGFAPPGVDFQRAARLAASF